MPSDTAPSDTRDDLRLAAFSAHGRDWNEAARAWELYRTHFPDDPDGFVFGTVSLREAGEHARAEALADSVLDVFAGHSRLFVERGLICFMTRDWPEAKRRFDAIRRKFPHEIDGYVRGSEVALNMGEHEEALALTEAVVQRHPDSRNLLEDYATLAERLAAPERAAAAWGAHRERYGEERAYLGEARALADGGDPAAGAALLDRAATLFPDSGALVLERARMAVRRADWADAIGQWTPFRDHPEHGAEARSRLADAERFMAGGSPGAAVAAGHMIGHDLASLVARRWTFRFKSGQVIARNMALAENGAVWNHYGAERAWDVRDGCIRLLDETGFVAVQFNTVETGEDGLLRLVGRDCFHPTQDWHFVLEEQRPSIATVLNAFESLGDNCEFGLVQRFYRVEPLALLRFNWSGYEQLLTALATNFAELDKPDCVRASRGFDGELIGHVDAYEFFYHTHRYNADIDTAAFERTEAGRLRYLADMLMENIEDGRRILVRKGEGQAELDKILRLHDCLKRIGDCTLLWVTEADDAHPSGTAEWVGPRLLRGYVERFSPYDAAGRSLFASWADMCVNAHRLVHPEAWTRQLRSF